MLFKTLIASAFVSISTASATPDLGSLLVGLKGELGPLADQFNQLVNQTDVSQNVSIIPELTTLLESIVTSLVKNAGTLPTISKRSGPGMQRHIRRQNDYNYNSNAGHVSDISNMLNTVVGSANQYASSCNCVPAGGNSGGGFNGLGSFVQGWINLAGGILGGVVGATEGNYQGVGNGGNYNGGGNYNNGGGSLLGGGNYNGGGGSLLGGILKK